MWISVGRLGEGFGPAAGSFHLPASASLAGRRLALHFEDGSATDYHFLSASEVIRAPRDRIGGRGQPESYRATEIRPAILFVDVVANRSPASTTSLVVDLQRGICTALTGSLPTEADVKVPLIERVRQGADLTRVRAAFLSGAVDGAVTGATERHDDTRELIGKRVEYTYSASERYEHVYLNERFYSWHCLAGSERGLADTDRCRYLKIADRLYLFVWREKIVPTLGAVLVDLEQMKTTGKIFGYRGFDFDAVVNFPIGARARLVGAA